MYYIPFLKIHFFPIRRDNWVSSRTTNRYRIIICKVAENNRQKLTVVLSMHSSSRSNYIAVPTFRLLWLLLSGPRAMWGGRRFTAVSVFQTAAGFYNSVWVDRGQRGEQTLGMETLQRQQQIFVAGLQYIYLELYSYVTDLGEWRYSSTYSYPYYSAKVWWIKCSLPHDLLHYTNSYKCFLWKNLSVLFWNSDTYSCVYSTFKVSRWLSFPMCVNSRSVYKLATVRARRFSSW